MQRGRGPHKIAPGPAAVAFGDAPVGGDGPRPARRGPPSAALRLAVLVALGGRGVAAQATDSAAAVILLPLTVTRSATPHDALPFAVSVVQVRGAAARPAWGIDEALSGVPGVFAAQRYNFALDQRIAIRGFGSRAAFAVRGIRVLVDGIPQTLPDGQGQLTHVDLGAVQRIEVLRGSASALHGNAAGGVISVTTAAPAPARWTQDLRVTAGTFDSRLARTWTRWQVGTTFPLGAGGVRLGASRLAYDGERDYSAADVRALAARLALPLDARWTLRAVADVGDQPRAENPGALTRQELEDDPAAAAPANVAQRAGKDVRQWQAGLTLHRGWAGGGEASLTAFGQLRTLENPLTFAYIGLDRIVWGARVVVSRPVRFAHLQPYVTAGLDWQEQRDDRVNRGNDGGTPDTNRLLSQVERVTEIGPFVQATLPVSARVAVTAGARFDAVRFRVADRLVTATNADDSGERTLAAATGSLGVTWEARTGARVYANVGSSFETPTTTELTNSPAGPGGLNDSLGPQRARTVEVGVRWSGAAAQGSVALFHADVRDQLIPYEVPAVPQRRFFRNAGRATHRGLEIGAAGRLTPWLALSGAYTYSDFFYRDYVVDAGGGPMRLDGRALPGIPAHRGQAALSLRGPGAGPWAELELIHTASVLVDDTLDVRAPAWRHVNLRLGWSARLVGRRLGAFIGVQNLLAARYVGSVVINAAQGRYYEPAPGRNGYLGVSFGGEP
jgi:iron complex outermembrane receptor protein